MRSNIVLSFVIVVLAWDDLVNIQLLKYFDCLAFERLLRGKLRMSLTLHFIYPVTNICKIPFVNRTIPS